MKCVSTAVTTGLSMVVKEVYDNTVCNESKAYHLDTNRLFIPIRKLSESLVGYEQ